MTRSRFKRTSGVALVVGTGLLAGCSLPPLTVDDKGEPVAFARATLRPAGAAGGLELEVGRVKGSQVQTIASNEPPDFSLNRLGGVSLEGPLLRNEAKHQWVQLVYHHRLFTGRTLEMAWFVGGAAGELDWRSTELGGRMRQVSQQSSWSATAAGASGRWNLTPTLFAEARVAGSVFGRGVTMRSFAELALGWQAAPALQLRVGMADSGIKLNPKQESSELFMGIRGPFATLVLGY